MTSARWASGKRPPLSRRPDRERLTLGLRARLPAVGRVGTGEGACHVASSGERCRAGDLSGVRSATRRGPARAANALKTDVRGGKREPG